MIAILQVGISQFAMEPKDASKVLELLSKAMRVERSFMGSRVWFHPPKDRGYRDELGLTMEDPSVILASEPKEDQPVPPPMSVRPAKQKPSKKPLRIAGPSRPLLGLPGFHS